MSLSSEKLQTLFQCSLNGRGKSCSKRQLQSFLSSLLHVSKCVKSARTFPNRMLLFIRSIGDKISVTLTPDIFNGVAYYDVRLFQAEMHVDAC